MIQSTFKDAPHSGAVVPWLAGLGVASLGSWVLYAALPGLNWTLWTVLASIAFVCNERCAGKRLPVARGVLLGLACLLAGGAAVTAQPFMHALVLLSLGMLAATLTLLTAGQPPALLGFSALISAPIRAALACLAAVATQLRTVLGLARAERSLPLLRGALLAVPVAMLFFLLLSAADPTMAGWRDTAWAALVALSFLPRLLFFLILAVASLGSYTLAAQAPAASVAHAQPRPRTAATMRGIERFMVLGAVATVFALFLTLQLSYLFGNPGARVGSGLRYADAVHRGFRELTVAAVLCLLLTLVLDRYARRGRHEASVKILTLVLIVEATALLVSAHLRISAYEQAYGYTLQRLYAHAHTIATGIALALLAWEVCVSIDARRLFRRVGLAAAMSVALFCYWNHAAWVARQNITRYQLTGFIDVSYLVGGLGDDALPEVVRSLPSLAAPLAQSARVQLEALRLARANAHALHWYEWNLRRETAQEALASLADAHPSP